MVCALTDLIEGRIESTRGTFQNTKLIEALCIERMRKEDSKDSPHDQTENGQKVET